MRLVIDPVRLKTLRLDRALTQRRLALMAGVDVKTVEHAECGHGVSLVTISGLARALKVAPTEFASRAER